MYEVFLFIWIFNSFKIVDLIESFLGYFNLLNDLKCSCLCGYFMYGVWCGDECVCFEVDCYYVIRCFVMSEYISDILFILKFMYILFLYRI